MSDELEAVPLAEDDNKVAQPFNRPTFRHVRDGRIITPTADAVAAYEAHPNWERAD